MLDQAAVEDLYSATYVETYLDAVENLPDDIQRHLSRMRELDVTYQAYLKEIEHEIDVTLRDSSDSDTRMRTQLQVEEALIAVQEVGDEKLQVIQQIKNLVENKASQLDLEYRHVEFGKVQENTKPNKETHRRDHFSNGSTASTSSGADSGERQSKRARRTRVATLTIEPAIPPQVIVTPEPVITAAGGTASTSTTNTTKKGSTGNKKTRKSQQSQQREESPPREDQLPVAIDPDESTYCLCELRAYGQMILCDNDLCPIKWFHFSCVNLVAKPKRRWFCTRCRGDRSNTMKPMAEFLKELAKYNKQKEEKEEKA